VPEPSYEFEALSRKCWNRSKWVQGIILSAGLLGLGILAFAASAREEWLAGTFWTDLPDWIGIGAVGFGFVGLLLWATLTAQGRPAIGIDIGQECLRIRYAGDKEARMNWTDPSFSLDFTRDNYDFDSGAHLQLRVASFRWKPGIVLPEEAFQSLIAAAGSAGLEVKTVPPPTKWYDEHVLIRHFR
jgi:hypothetical protein